MIEFSHALHPRKLIALIMPLYRISLREVLDAADGEEIEWSAFLFIAKGLLAAGETFETCGLAHCDLKPSNIMMDKSVPVVIDLGSTVKLGSFIEQYTPFLALDADLKAATPAFDLNCIIVTLVMCFMPNFQVQFRTKKMLRRELETVEGALASYAKICLHALDFESCSSARAGLAMLQDN
jgi:serine/threonine protein kinase